MRFTDGCRKSTAARDQQFPPELLVETAFGQNQVGMVIVRANDGIIIEANDAWLKIVDRHREEVIGRKMLELDIVVPAVEQEVDWNRLGKGQPVTAEFVHRTGKGETKSCLAKTNQIVRGGKRYYVTSVLDISDRKQAEAQAEKSRLLFETFFYEAPTPMMVLSGDELQVINVNKAWEAMVGLSRNEAVGQKIDSMPAVLSRPQNSEALDKLRSGDFFRGDFDFVTHNGEIRYGFAQIRPVDMAGRKCYLAAVEDVTDRRLAEREYTRLSGLNLAGEMAASIGHEVRNPLTTVRGYLQLMSRQPEMAEHYQRLDMMIGELDRANHIISEFLSVAKDNKNDREIININEVIASLFPIMQASAAMEEKEMVFDAGAIPQLCLDPKEMRQLILNLVKNGMEAMNGKGTVTIRTMVNRTGDTVLAVEDQGRGIPTDIIDRVGQPFFTTKEGGTGLGLAVCYSIARRNRGRISIDSRPTGTTVSVEFPREVTDESKFEK